MLSSPRSPSSTTRIFSSAEKCRRVARRIFFMTCSAGSLTNPDFCLIVAPLKATMNQKSSLPQSAKSVSEVLTPDSPKPQDARPASRLAAARSHGRVSCVRVGARDVPVVSSPQPRLARMKARTTSTQPGSSDGDRAGHVADKRTSFTRPSRFDAAPWSDAWEYSDAASTWPTAWQGPRTSPR